MSVGEIREALRRVTALVSEAIIALVAAEDGLRQAAETTHMLEFGSATGELHEAAQGYEHARQQVVAAIQTAQAVIAAIERYPEYAPGDPVTARPSSPPASRPDAVTRRAAQRSTLRSWVEEERSKLPGYVTSGRYFDPDGHGDVVQSGRASDGAHEKIADFLRENGFLLRSRGSPAMTKHVEAKVAWRMRETQDPALQVELVINNEMCVGPESCLEYLEDILFPGQVLIVHDPARRRVFRGRQQ
ncbi:hypothetical protein GTS_52740 [Gandjariella thermophila]|uniref:SCP1.201-like deaminase n=2 Tax=Gandjariella thermophila TaxID=1931992 RepID=A0A4D4JAE3_9PSEU|nr:hypothetical protein GTS_52740 [Gandjariella thermophila]